MDLQHTAVIYPMDDSEDSKTALRHHYISVEETEEKEELKQYNMRCFNE